MGEVRVNRSPEREIFWIAVERAVGLRVVGDICPRQATEELSHITSALRSSQAVTWSVIFESALLKTVESKARLTPCNSTSERHDKTRNPASLLG